MRSRRALPAVVRRFAGLDGRSQAHFSFFLPKKRSVTDSSLRTGGIYFLFSLTELPYAKLNSLQRGRNRIGAARAHKTHCPERLVLLTRLFIFFFLRKNEFLTQT